MFDIDASLPAEVIPLSWLLGVWEGTGVIAYKVGDDVREHEFRQRIAFTNDGGPHVQYACSAWLADADGADLGVNPLFSELGYWRLSRPLGTADPGPGMLPGVGDAVFTTADAVETLRNAAGRFRHRGLDPAAVGGERALPRNRRRCRASISAPTPSCARPPRRSTPPPPACTASSTTTCCGRGTSRPSAKTCAPTPRDGWLELTNPFTSLRRCRRRPAAALRQPVERAARTRRG